MSTTTKDRGAVSPMARVLAYASQRPGVLLHLAEITKATGLTERQVQQAISNARRAVIHDGKALGIFTPQIRGRAWMYTPPGEHAPQTNGHTPPQPTSTLFELVGPARDGTLVIQGEDGSLYLARPVTS